MLPARASLVRSAERKKRMGDRLVMTYRDTFRKEDLTFPAEKTPLLHRATKTHSPDDSPTPETRPESLSDPGTPLASRSSSRPSAASPLPASSCRNAAPRRSRPHPADESLPESSAPLP